MPQKPSTCLPCPAYGWTGYQSAPEGSLEASVALVGEGLSEAEAATGRPFSGKAGGWLTALLGRHGMERSSFVIDNVIRCHPPDGNFNLAYENGAAFGCAAKPRHLSTTLALPTVKATVAMGPAALRHLLDLPSSTSLKPYLGYPTYSFATGKWVIPSWHPSFLFKGNQRFSGVFAQHVLKAFEIAQGKYTPAPMPTVVVDPLVEEAEEWIRSYERRLFSGLPTWLAFDIETPYKASSDGEDEGELEFNDPTFTILRVGFAYQGSTGLSLPWRSDQIRLIQRLLGSSGPKVSWNGRYDIPRLLANGITINGPEWDMMWGWHVINSDLDKGLGFVTPLLTNLPRWKHLGDTNPGLYNGVDAVATIRNAERIYQDLHTTGLWPVFDRHVVQMDRILDCFNRTGIQIDQVKRKELSLTFSQQLEDARVTIDAAVPLAAKTWEPKKGFKRTPKSLEGLIQIGEQDSPIKYCPLCGEVKVGKPHFKEFKKKVNPCANATASIYTERTPAYARPVAFVPSNIRLKAYALSQKHKPIQKKDKKSGKISTTFDDDALKALGIAYPSDPVYPLVQKYREIEKQLGYVGIAVEGGFDGGMPQDRNGRVHTILGHTPSTLRFSSVNPNLQNQPRTGPIRSLFIPDPGFTLAEVDYCVAPEVKILCQDLTWRRADTIEVGAKIIGFDEHVINKKHDFIGGVVTGVKTIERPRIKIVTTQGDITVSTEHRFWVKRHRDNAHWCHAKDLQVGNTVRFIEKPWDVETTYDAGWLAGMFDGEGWITQTKIGIGQNEGPTLDRVRKLLTNRGFTFNEYTNKHHVCCEYLGSMGEGLRLLGQIRPPRLLQKAQQFWENRRTWGKRTKVAEVLSVEFMGPGPVIAIETDIKTYIANGFFSHNCAIEAVVVGYLGQSQDYCRLAKLGVHDFLNSHILARSGKIERPADIAWSDAELALCFADLKKRFGPEREIAKRCVHAFSYGMSAHEGFRKYPEVFGSKANTSSLRSLFYDVCPAIPTWQEKVVVQAEEEGSLKTPFGYQHRFWRVCEYKQMPDGEWERKWGDDAKRAIAFGPQATAAGIIKEAMLALEEEFSLASKGWMLLQIHDSLVFQFPDEEVDRWLEIVIEVMTRPLRQLPLPWDPVNFLTIGVEAKSGKRWGDPKHGGGMNKWSK